MMFLSDISSAINISNSAHPGPITYFPLAYFIEMLKERKLNASLNICVKGHKLQDCN